MAVLVALALVPVWGTSSLMRTLVEFLSLLVLAQFWNLLAGYTGLVSIGQQAYIGLGGYALIALADLGGLDPFVSVLLAGLVAALFALPTAALVFRFRGGYFAVGTWVVAEVYRLLIANTTALGGGSGKTLAAIQGVSRATREMVTYWMALALGAGSILLVYLLLRSRMGLALTAIRDSELASATLGVNVFRVKVLIYILSAFGCGVTGALIYLNLLRISPQAAFTVNWSAFMIFIVIIGGIGTIEGPIVGTLVFFLLREFLSGFGAWYMILLGSLAVITVLRAPQGLWGIFSEASGIKLFPVQRHIVRARGPVPGAAAGKGTSPSEL